MRKKKSANISPFLLEHYNFIRPIEKYLGTSGYLDFGQFITNLYLSTRTYQVETLNNICTNRYIQNCQYNDYIGDFLLFNKYA